jgi:hypothetical protein
MDDLAYIGIDPGSTGAIAVINGPNVTIFDIPHVEVKRNGKVRRRVDVVALCRLARSLAAVGAGRVLVEDLWIAGGDNPSSAEGLIRCAAYCEAAFVAAGFDVSTVPPQTWKAAYGIAGAGMIEADRGKRRALLKTRAREKAMQLFPAHEKEFARVKDADKAEATLIADFGRRAAAG